MIKNSAMAALMALGLGACGSAGEELEPPTITHSYERSRYGALSGSESELITAQAAVESIDYDSRRITVRDYYGQSESFIVSPEVKRLREIKAGDRIEINYIRATAFEVREPTAAEMRNPALAAAALGKQPLHLPPGAAAARITRSIVTVEGIDYEAKTVTLKTSDGRKVTVIAREAENLKRLKVGDTIAVSYGEAVVVDVRHV